MTKSTPNQRKNGSRTYIDPNDFYLMRRRAFLTTEGAAQLLDVTHRTILNWEKGRARIPYTAYRVLKIKVGYLFDDEHFGDWFVRGDTLWSPEGRGFKPYELRYISHYFWMARKWLDDRRHAAAENPTPNPNPKTIEAPLLVADGASSATAEQGALPRQALQSLRLTVAGQQGERPKDFERFLELVTAKPVSALAEIKRG